MDLADMECKVVVLVGLVEDNGQLSNFCRIYIIFNFTFSEPCILQYVCENYQQDAHFISFICFSYTILYMFRTAACTKVTS